MAHSQSLLGKVTRIGPFVTTNFQFFGHYSNKNQDIFLKFSAFVHHQLVLNWQKNFGHCFISWSATAHFSQNFDGLQRPYLLRYFETKKTGVVLDHFLSLIERKFEYLEKNGVLKFFKRQQVHLINDVHGVSQAGLVFTFGVRVFWIKFS